MSTNPSEIADELLKFARDYKHNPNQHVVLEPYREAVLMLRAKYATYETITETLNANGVKVSEATVRNFCRRNHAEVKRLRGESEAKKRESTGNGRATPAGTPESPASADGKRPPLTPDIGKRGPRIARDEL